jgi:hypothetical protein
MGLETMTCFNGDVPAALKAKGLGKVDNYPQCSLAILRRRPQA